MERAVHPALQKRIVEIDPASGNDRLREMSAKTLVQFNRTSRSSMSIVNVLWEYKVAKKPGR
jgi:hypothetical protein